MNENRPMASNTRLETIDITYTLLNHPFSTTPTPPTHSKFVNGKLNQRTVVTKLQHLISSTDSTTDTNAPHRTNGTSGQSARAD